MRRRNAASVRVKNPSRGLVKRLPPETADKLFDGDMHRTFSEASNVRFDDGVVRSAGGLFRITLAGTALDTRVQRIHKANLVDGSNPICIVTEGKIFTGAVTFTSSPRTYTLTLTQKYSGTATNYTYKWSVEDFYDKVLFAQHSVQPQYWKSGTVAVLPGLPASTNYDGVTSFAGHVILWKDDVLLWSDLNDFSNYIPIAETAANFTYTVRTAFTNPAALSNVAIAVNEAMDADELPVGTYIRIIENDNYNYYSVVSHTNGAANTCAITARLENLTGYRSSGTVAVGATIRTLIANEAGTAQNVGAQINGPIYAVLPMAQYAFILKEWSIQSVQYVGQASGTFYARPDVTDEGLIARNAFCKRGTDRLVFLGHRELYDYRLGSAPQPVAVQYTRQLFTELDRGNLDKVWIWDRDDKNEIHVFYPVTGSSTQKVLVWNYVENTCSIDDYSSSLGGLVAGGFVNWSTDPSWDDLPITALWQDALGAWTSYSASGAERVAVVATGSETAAAPVYGLCYHDYGTARLGSSLTSLAETMDFDFGDDTLFKYIECVRIGVQVAVRSPIPSAAKSLAVTPAGTLGLQIGYRDDIDDDITWTTLKTISIGGNGQTITKINPGGAGRFIRLRLYSSSASTVWRVSSFDIFARLGNAY